MNEDNIKGSARKIEGTVESTFGNLTGNKTTEAKGELRKAAGSAQDALGEAEDKVLDLAGKFRGLIDHASEDFQDATRRVNDSIHEQPVRSSVLALGLGLLVGFLIAR